MMNTIQTYIISFDIAAIFVFVITLYYVFSNGLYKRNSGGVFIVFVIMTLVTAVYDIFGSYTIDHYGEKDWITYSMVRNSNVLFFFFRTISILSYLVYMIEITYTLKFFLKKKKITLMILFLPFLINVILVLLTIKFPIIFKLVINDDGTISYIRNLTFIIIFYLVMIYSSIIIMYLLIKCKRFFSSKQFLSILSIIPLTIIGLLVQIISEMVLIAIFSQALSIILIVTSIENISEQIEPKTHLGNYKRFTSDVKRVYFTKNDQSVLIVKISNYHELYRLYTIPTAIAYLRKMVKIQSSEYKKVGINETDFYSLGNGVYALISSQDSIEKASKFVYRSINEELIDGFDFKPVGSICIMDCLVDFNSWEDLLDFITAYKNLSKYDNELSMYKNIKNDKSFLIEKNLELIIDTGLKENEFEVYFQPIYNIKDNKFTSAEALVRLNSKKYGFIRPDMFISYAEHNGKIGEIDNYVFEKVSEFVMSDEFKELGLEYIEVNLSVAECSDSNFASRIENIINKYNLDTKRINLEITESFDYTNKNIIDANIIKLKELGFSFSLDDYGVGYSNIERFAKLPISIVKIDKSLVDDVDKPEIESVLIDTFKLINGLERSTVIEGVETKEQLNKFISFGATYIQGYYFSKPLSYDDFIKFIKDKNKGVES